MGFNNVMPAAGPYYLDAGASMIIELKFGASSWSKPGAEKGAQWIMANPYPPKKGALQVATQLQVSNFYKRRDYLGGIEVIGEEGEDGTIGGTPNIVYGVTVTNVGRTPAYFSVQGGATRNGNQRSKGKR